jgi:anti-sigma factor RsiW
VNRTCREFRKLISLDMDGELAGEGPERLRAHLDACAGCRAEHRLWLRIRDVIREEEAASSGSVATRVLASLQERRESSERILPLVRRLAAAAALLLVASTAALLALGPREASAPSSVAPRGSDLAHSIILNRAGDEALRLVDDERESSR